MAGPLHVASVHVIRSVIDLEQFALPSARAAAVSIDETQLAAWRKRGNDFAR